MSDSRLDALRDMLLEGRNPEALRLIAEIATEQPKMSPLEKLRALRRDVRMETGERIAIEVMVPDERFVDLAEHITGGRSRTYWQSGDIEHRFLAVAPGIDVRGELAAARSAGLPPFPSRSPVDDVIAAAIPAPWVCQHCGEWRADGNAVAHDCRPHL